ncbi:MAG TPA: PAS domain S-box protein, partial [Acidimicrobiia bacterium]|nr:PAS domain S-box protein [Acidimicrobiia bacterium]
MFSFRVTEEAAILPEWVGGAHKRLTGYSVEEMAEAGISSWEPFIHPDDLARWQENGRQLAAGHQTTDEYRIISREGDVRWVRVTSIPETSRGRVVRIYGSAVDLTDQRLAEERYRMVADLVSDVAFELRIVDDGPAQLMWVTGSLERITGYRAEDWAEHGWRMLVHPGDQDAVEEAFEAAAAGDTRELEVRVNTASGETRWIHLTTRPFEDEGTITRVVAAARDITTERRAREHVAAAVTRLNEAHALAGLGTWQWDERERRLTGSREFAAVLGVPAPVDITDTEFYGRVHRDDVVELQAALVKAEKELSATGLLEFRIVHPDGSQRFVLGRGRALGDEHGTFTGFLGTILDITERHRIETALRDSEERYRALVELSPSPIIIQRDNLIVYANPAAAEFLHVPEGEHFVGRRLLDVVVPAERPQMAAQIERFRIDDVESGAAELTLQRFDGGEVYAEVRWAPVRFEGEPATQIVAHDVTERQRVQEALELALARQQEASERLRETDRLKDAFLTQISHELRTPLTPIIGFALTLRDRLHDLDDPTRHQILDILVSNADQMARMVERLLDFTQLQAGHLGVFLEPLELATTVRRIVATFEPLTVRHRVEVVAPEGVTVLADPAGLDRVLGNLVANAVKYAPPGTTIRVVAEVGSDNEAVVRVEDEGPGFPADLDVFERFVQG